MVKRNLYGWDEKRMEVELCFDLGGNVSRCNRRRWNGKCVVGR